jgi:hypothetical protein
VTCSRPRTLVERCVDVGARDLQYLRVAAIAVDNNAQPWSGLRLRHDGEAFSVCFLARPDGRYRVELVVEDPRARTVVLESAVDDL